MQAPSPRASIIAAAGLIALAAGMGIGRFVYTPILPFMEDAVGLTKAQGGLIASANFLGYLFGALAASLAHLPGSRRAWLLVALAVSAVTTGLMGVLSGFETFLLVRFAGGAASAFVLVFASALVLDRLSEIGRPGLSAAHFAGVGTGIALSAVITFAVASVGLDWREQWQASGAISLVAVALVSRMLPGDPVRAQASADAAGGSAPGIFALIFAYGLFGFGYVITATFIATMVRATPEIAPLESVIWLVVGIAAIPSVALWTWAGRRIGNSRAFALACVIEGLGVALSVLAPQSAMAVSLGAALLGGTFMGITALGFVEVRRMTPGDPRRNLALMTAAFGLGQVIGPTFAGMTYAIGESFLVPSLVASLALLIAAALTIRLRAAMPA